MTWVIWNRVILGDLSIFQASHSNNINKLGA
jgi:hypothetical protein